VEEILHSAQQLPLPKEHSTYRIAASRSHLSKETADFIEQEKKIHEEIELISSGSSLKFCMLAEGRIDCYPRFAPTMEWDTAAGQAICNAAGAAVIDWTTKAAMVYNRENLLNGSFVVRRHNSPPK
jgi:3'(2'), 5'-bisphosphate nucleotidase